MSENTLEAARTNLKAAVARRAEVSRMMANRSGASTTLDREIRRATNDLRQAEAMRDEAAANPGPKTITAMKAANREIRKARDKLDELEIIHRTLIVANDGEAHYLARHQLDEARARFAAAYEADQTALLGENVEFMGRLHKAYAAWLWRGNEDDWGLFLGETIPAPSEPEVDAAFAIFETEHAGPAMTLDETV